MKKKFITLGALAIMLAFSSVEVKANDLSSTTTPETITQGKGTREYLSKFDFKQRFITIISDVTEFDRCLLEEKCREYTFYQIGIDSLDWLVLTDALEDEFDIMFNDYYNYEFEMWYGRIIDDYISYVWEKKYTRRW